MHRGLLVVVVVDSVFGTNLKGPSLLADEALAQAAHPVNVWVKRSPLAGTPVSPRLGYEGACVWDSRHRLLIRYGGHNQGGGGEGSHEGTLIYDPWSNEWRWPKPAREPEPRSGGNLAYDAASKLHVLFG